MLKFCQVGLTNSITLLSLDLSHNELGPVGIANLFEKGMHYNNSLIYLDLFNVDITTNSVPSIINTLGQNTSLYSLRMANTHVNLKFLVYLWDFLKQSKTIKIVRWINISDNITGHADYEPFFINRFDKMMLVDCKPYKVKSRGVY